MLAGELLFLIFCLKGQVCLKLLIYYLLDILHLMIDTEDQRKEIRQLLLQQQYILLIHDLVWLDLT